MLNFKYDARNKSVYVDGHEHNHVVESQKEFCKQYLTALEIYCRLWVQGSKEDTLTWDGLASRLLSIRA